MNVKDIRRENLRYLSKQSGGISALARRLGKSQSQVSHIIGVHPIKNIGDRLAAHIEQIFEKPSGWLDREHPEILRELGIEPGALMERASPIKWVPVIIWQNVRDWSNSEDKAAIHLIAEYVPIALNLGRKAFATRLQQKSFSHTADGQTDFVIPKDAIIVVDPEFPIRDNVHVLTLTEGSNKITLNQYFIKNNQPHLNSLESQSLSTQSLTHHQILGVIRHIQLDLEK